MELVSAAEQECAPLVTQALVALEPRHAGFGLSLESLAHLGPKATHLVFSWISAKYGDSFKSFADKYGPAVRAGESVLIDPADLKAIHDWIEVFIPREP